MVQCIELCCCKAHPSFYFWSTTATSTDLTAKVGEIVHVLERFMSTSYMVLLIYCSGLLLVAYPLVSKCASSGSLVRISSAPSGFMNSFASECGEGAAAGIAFVLKVHLGNVCFCSG